MKNFAKKIMRFGCSILLRLKIVKPEIIVAMDGGICSQMHQYLLGCIFAKKGCRVSYDLSWFKKRGKDMNGIFERNFDLLKAFPTINFRKSNPLKACIYRRIYSTQNNYFDHSDEDVFLFDITPPKYLGGYFHTPKIIFLDFFSNYFCLNPDVLNDENKALYDEIKQKKNSVAVHVRRGDLSDVSAVYGAPASVDYFQKAVSYFCEELDTPFFYFFSDEPDWVKKELTKTLQISDNQYQVVDINGSNKGYMDLFLIASCAHQIASKGSLGKFGACLNTNSEKIVVLCDEPTEYVWKERLLKTVFL